MNTRMLNERADMLELCQELGIETKKRGRTYYVHCPLPDHEDVHATNCFFKEGDSFMYCAVCQKAISGIDLIMYTENLEFLPAAKKLAELEGVKWEDTDQNSHKSGGYSILPGDARRIGLRLEKRILHPFRQSLYQESPTLKNGAQYDDQFTDSYVVGTPEFPEDILGGTALADMVLEESRHKRDELVKRIRLLQVAGLDASDVRLRLAEVCRIGKKASHSASAQMHRQKSGN